MKAAIVTGATSGIGLEISKRLVELGYKVYGIGRNFSKTAFTHDRFIPVPCDVTDLSQLTGCVHQIKENEDEIFILVNNAGVGFFGPHETLKPDQIALMVATNLQAPLILTQMLLREIRKTRGYIINISSITAKKPSTFGCAYAATKAGLSHFSASLFEEVRKSGIKVVTIHPDIVKTPFYDHLDFREGDDPDTYITPACVADAVQMVLSQREGTILSEIVLRPQRHQIIKKRRNPSNEHPLK